MSIESILAGKRAVVGIAPDSPVSAIVRLLHEHRIGAVLVLEGDSICGIVSERDIAAGLHTHGAAILDCRADEVMTAPVVTIASAMSVAEAMSVMTNRRIRHLPVVQSGVLVGLVSIGDLVKQRIEDAEREAGLLKDYIAMA